MRTQEEILTKIEELKDEKSDPHGAYIKCLIEALEYKYAKVFYPYITREDWSKTYLEPSAKNIHFRMQLYLPFATIKIRSEFFGPISIAMNKYAAWIWLINKEDQFENVQNYLDFGLAHLTAITEYLNEEGF